MTQRWNVVVPLKDSAVGKSRLASYGDGRAELARAMALDTLEAVHGAALVAQIVLVTSDVTIVETVDRWSDVTVISDPGAGLADAITAGIAAVASDQPAAIVTADLPALRSAALDEALTQASGHQQSVVADADAVGTTLLAARRARDLRPRFGDQSLAAHLALGAHLLDAPRGLRRDADLPDHLDGLGALLGARTAQTVARLAIP